MSVDAMPGSRSKFVLPTVMACAALFAAVGQAAVSGDFAGLVDIGAGRKMYLECRGTAPRPSCWWRASRVQPTIGALPRHPKPTVFAEVAKFTRVCAYDRPGTPVGEKPSRSDPVRQPTTAGDAVADLHALLSAASVVRPYVLVGHSYGGLIVRLYASTYPDDVSGLVLVDALSEGLRDAETPAQWVTQRKLMEGEIRDSLVQYPDLERIDPDRSFDQVRAAPPLRPLPAVVLSADRAVGPQIPVNDCGGRAAGRCSTDFGYIIDAAQKQAQERLAKLVPNAKHVTRTNSGHESTRSSLSS